MYLETSGSHWAVRLGHSKAWVITRSYRKGVFFFQILYSSFITLSSTASSNAPTESDYKNMLVHFEIVEKQPLIKTTLKR